MTTIWNLLTNATLGGTFLIGVALALLAALRKASAAQRHLIWTATLTGVLALPFLIRCQPALFHARNGAAGLAFLRPLRVVVRPDGSAAGPDLVRILVVLWAVGAVALLVRWAAALTRIWHITLQARTASDPLLAVSSSQVGVRQPVELRYCNRLASPVIWGLCNPVILLPDRIGHQAPEQRRFVLLHELAHIQRRDWAELCLTQLASALFWFHPLIWLAVREIGRERERACDDRVVEITAAPDRYAEQLLHVARGARSERFSAAMAMVTGSELEDRIMAILDGKRRRDRLRWYGPLLAGLVTLGLLVPLAALAQEKENGSQPSQSRPSKIRVSANMMQSKLVYKVTPLYPAEAKRGRIQGVVLLRVNVGEDGSVQDLDVMSGAPELVQAAADAVRLWRYQPVLLNGSPISVETTVEVNFTLAP